MTAEQRMMYSLGHSTMPLEQLAELCKNAGIDLVADIRRFPGSRRNPQFKRENLEAELPEHGIAYVWLGSELGGFRKGGYDEWMATAEFERGLEMLEALDVEHTVGFMCAEAVPWKCHRRFVARALAARGHRVAHLLPDGRIAWEEAPLPDP